MIVVTLGTNEQPFDRLARAARNLPAEDGLLVQYGSSTEQHGPGQWVDYLSFDALKDAMQGAGAVVSHAGVGSILLARQCGLRPIVMPRLRSRREAVDDHQLHFARRMATTSQIRLVEDEGDLPAVAAQATCEPRVGVAEAGAFGSALASELGVYLQEICGAASRGTATRPTPHEHRMPTSGESEIYRRTTR